MLTLEYDYEHMLIVLRVLTMLAAFTTLSLTSRSFFNSVKGPIPDFELVRYGMFLEALGVELFQVNALAFNRPYIGLLLCQALLLFGGTFISVGVYNMRKVATHTVLNEIFNNLGIVSHFVQGYIESTSREPGSAIKHSDTKGV